MHSSGTRRSSRATWVPNADTEWKRVQATLQERGQGAPVCAQVVALDEEEDADDRSRDISCTGSR
jgi:hypothetical protein